MKVIETVSEMHQIRRQCHGTVGVVPTMGYLHDGHMSLVHRARHENDTVIATIFVNPAQFGQGEDLDSYPRNLRRDCEKLEQAGADFVFIPADRQMYPPDYQTYVTVEKVTQLLEGAVRPSHFRGVTTVVAKLFNLTRPTRAYFGQKDAQQVRVIQQMVADLNYDLEIVVCPTVREEDGVAMSSRNSYLSPAERTAARVLNRALRDAETRYLNGVRDAAALRATMRAVLESEPLAQVEYISVANMDSLSEADQIQTQALASMAVRIGTARLIDNVVLNGQTTSG